PVSIGRRSGERMGKAHITSKLFAFLRELEKNNNREWFTANKSRYEEHVKAPLLAFVGDIEAPLMKVSPHVVADPSPVGGSMFRIYRDVRFSKDKRPYKTHASLQFRHIVGKDVHAPGLYVHFEPGSCFAGGGLWRPESKVLKAIRSSIHSDPKGWKRAIGGKAFKEHFALGGESLKRAPKGYDPEDPQIEDLKRKDFIATWSFKQSDTTKPEFMGTLIKRFKAMTPLMKFLTDANGLEY
ncbi:MAG: DUF2461 domain-containing protein, partial [Myxococcota bacterium]